MIHLSCQGWQLGDPVPAARKARTVREAADPVWSINFMRDQLEPGRRYAVSHPVDGCNRTVRYQWAPQHLGEAIEKIQAIAILRR